MSGIKDDRDAVKEINTTRFGRLQVQEEDLIRFPKGMVGFEHCTEWVLLDDIGNDSIGWLQSITDPQVALAVVSPRRYVSGYQVRLPNSELTPLRLTDVKDAQVLVILAKHDGMMTLNLKAPLVINPEDRLGRQVITGGDWPVRFALTSAQPMQLRKSA